MLGQVPYLAHLVGVDVEGHDMVVKVADEADHVAFLEVPHAPADDLAQRVDLARRRVAVRVVLFRWHVLAVVREVEGPMPPDYYM